MNEDKNRNPDCIVSVTLQLLEEIQAAENQPLELPRRFSPEAMGALAAYFLPQAIRKECFEPYLEELKEDRIRAAAVAKTKLAGVIVETGFLFRLLITFLQSLVCWFWKIFPVGEIFRSIFKTGGQ